jgi:hypothetical protein
MEKCTYGVKATGPGNHRLHKSWIDVDKLRIGFRANHVELQSPALPGD